MECPKCKGLMSYEEFSDLSSNKFRGWRCIPCGTIIDILILKNRAMPPREVKRGKPRMPRKPTEDRASSPKK